jgi:hypothetical protein
VIAPANYVPAFVPDYDFTITKKTPANLAHLYVLLQAYTGGLSATQGQATSNLRVLEENAPPPPDAIWGGGVLNLQMLLEPDPVASSPVSAVRPDLAKVYRSGPKPSGDGKDFGPWWSQCSEDPPAEGYVIKSEHFQLVGDRQCGAWSECKQVSKTPARVCYEFRMQGHDEWTGPLGSATLSGGEPDRSRKGLLQFAHGAWTDALGCRVVPQDLGVGFLSISCPLTPGIRLYGMEVVKQATLWTVRKDRKIKGFQLTR